MAAHALPSGVRAAQTQAHATAAAESARALRVAGSRCNGAEQAFRRADGIRAGEMCAAEQSSQAQMRRAGMQPVNIAHAGAR
jgi:hypothetical protein